MPSFPINSVIELFIPIILVIIWVVRRRKIKRKYSETDREKTKYTTIQIFGIIGILFFLLPIFWIVASALIKGIYILIILLIGWIELPTSVSTILKSITKGILMFLSFSGIYLICELLWPKRNTS